MLLKSYLERKGSQVMLTLRFIPWAKEEEEGWRIKEVSGFGGVF